MNREEFASWAARAWVKQVGNNTPLARSIRSGKAGHRALKKESLKLRRGLAAEHGSKMRSLRKQQSESEEVMWRRWAELDAAAEKRRWEFLLKQ